jgi:hypothetical protein
MLISIKPSILFVNPNLQQLEMRPIGIRSIEMGTFDGKNAGGVRNEFFRIGSD